MEAGAGLDEATRERTQQRAEYLHQERARLLQELERKSLEQSDRAWGAPLVRYFWALLGVLVVLLALGFGLGKMRRHPDNSSGHKESSSSNDAVAPKDTEGKQSSVEEESNDGCGAGSCVDATEEEVNSGEKREEVNAAGHQEDRQDANEEDDEQKANRNLGSLPEELIRLPVVELEKGCLMIRYLVGKLTHIFGQGLSDAFYPVPQDAIGVGSAFEGWSPRAEDAVYSVPLSPPPGHSFQLELDTAGMPQRTFRVRVELLCTCTRERLGQDMLCCLPHPEEELRRKQEPSLLHTLCTGSYLDVEKTAHWFCRFVRVAWLLLPESRHWSLKWQPSRRCCKFQLSQDKESFTAEVVFGVRRGDSDVFVGSQPAEGGTPSTTWLETCAVAEAKFFRLISRQAPQDSWHCKCLQLLSRSLLGVGLSSYTLKTVLMHLLSTGPLTRWHRRHFQQRLLAVLKFLHCSLQTGRLKHFVIGNQRFPLEISLPSDLRLAEAANLFQHLAGDWEAHLKAVQEYICLLHGLKRLLVHGH